MDGGMSVEESKKSVEDSGTVISELWCLPGLNLSRIDAESRIGFRFVGEGDLEESRGKVVEPPSQPSSIIVPPHLNSPSSPLNALFEFHFIFQ